MNFGQAILEALESLSANKMRSGLTILGIVIGVAAVIAMLAVGQGAQNSITGSINGIGTNVLFVFRSTGTNDSIRNPQALTLGDAQAIADPVQAPSVAAVAPTIQGNVELNYGGEKLTVTMNGVVPDFQRVRNWKLAEGDFITNEQNLGHASVAVIGVDVADNLLKTRVGIIGETIRVNGQPFRVIGLLESKGGSSFGSEDNVIMVPFNTAEARLTRRNNGQVDIIYVEAATSEAVDSATEEITQILRQRHRILLGEDDFSVFSQQTILSTAQTITGVFTVFLGGIAGISLLVGGIGIMNIMLVSVTERTREIGLRKAIGARRRDILIQFLTESALLSLLGGVVGIAFGYLISFIVGRIATANNTPFTPAVGMNAILIATIFSTAVGLFFGLYPANRAASLEPVEALRHE